MTKTWDNCVSLVLPKATKSLNKTQGGKTWQARHHRNKTDLSEWGILLRSEIARHCRAEDLAFPVRCVHITRVWGKGERAFDNDNLVGGCKALVDAMKGLLIVDDSPAHCKITYGQLKGPTKGAEKKAYGFVEGGSTIVTMYF